MKILTNFDFTQNEIQNAKIQNLATAPANPVAGQVYYNSTTNRLFYFNGSTWVASDSAESSLTGAQIIALINADSSIIDLDNLPASVGTAVTNSHTHSNKATLDATTASFTTAKDTKLSGIADNANNYVHPENHPPSIITQDSTNRFVTDAEKTAWNAKQAALGFTPENSANKGVANGYAGLDSNAKVPLAQLPDTAKQYTHVVLNATARNALTGLLSGDKAFETSTKDTYIWDGSAWQLLSDADWENINLEWTNINGRPSSTVANIDSAVTASHARQHAITSASDHSNMSANTIAGRISTAGTPQELTATQVRTIINVADGANNYTHPSDGGGSVSALTGANVISALTVNSAGHVTASATRELTPANIGATSKYAVDIGNGTLTSFTVTHNLNTRDVTVTIRENASPYAMVMAEIEMTTVNSITVKVAQAPTSNQYRVIVVG